MPQVKKKKKKVEAVIPIAQKSKLRCRGNKKWKIRKRNSLLKITHYSLVGPDLPAPCSIQCSFHNAIRFPHKPIYYLLNTPELQGKEKNEVQDKETN